MPCYLFTFHAYRSWMPNHRRGYTRRGVGYVAFDPVMNARYVARAGAEPTVFDARLQATVVTHLLDLPMHVPVRLHAVTTEPSHIHVLLSWRLDRGWLSLRTSVKTSLTRFLRERSDDRRPLRLSRGASRKRVVARDHFDYLMTQYLPKHAGVCWFEDKGWIAARREAREKHGSRATRSVAATVASKTETHE